MVVAESPASVPKNSSSAGTRSLRLRARADKGAAGLRRSSASGALVGWQDHALEPPSLPIPVHPLVVDPRSPNLHRSRSQEDFTFPGAPVANDQGVAVLVALILGRIQIGFDLRLHQGLGQHLPRSGSGDLVEIEHELPFTLCLVLMYSEHSGVSFPPTRQRRIFRLPSREGTPRASQNLRSTTSNHISV